MSNMVTVNKQEIQIKEYQGQRVVTFKEIDAVHGRPEGTAKRNFNQNKQHLLEGKDYFKIQPYEIRTVGIASPNGGYVLTESGYLMLVKSFTDSLAWKVQRQLVDTYFHAKSEQLTIQEQEQYQYRPKTYKGQQVITFRDLEHFTGKPAKNLCNVFTDHIKKFRAGVDYWLLLGEDLNTFKQANRIVNHPMRHLYILTRSGFQKLGRILQSVPKTLPCFAPLAPAAKSEPPKQYKVDYANSPQLERCINTFNQKIRSIYSVINLLDKNPTEEQYRAYLQTIRDLTLHAYVYTAVDLPRADYSAKPC